MYVHPQIYSEKEMYRYMYVRFGTRLSDRGSKAGGKRGVVGTCSDGIGCKILYIYVYIYIYRYIFIYIYIYVYIYIYRYIYTYVNTHTCIFICIYMYKNIPHIYVCMYVHMYVYIHIYIYLHIQIRRYICKSKPLVSSLHRWHRLQDLLL